MLHGTDRCNVILSYQPIKGPINNRVPIKYLFMGNNEEDIVVISS